MAFADEYHDEDDFEPIEGYCVRCRESVEIEDPMPVWTRNGLPATRGECPICGGTVFRMGKLRVEFVARATLGASVAAAQLRTTLIDIALESGGSFMPGSLAWATRAQAEACFPMLGEFLAERRRLDPAERLCTPWVRDASRVWRGERCRVRFGDS